MTRKPWKQTTQKKKISVSKRRKTSKRRVFKNNELLSNAKMRQHLIELAGENAVNVLREFGFEMTDEDLARKSKTKLSDVRAVLNKLHTTGLVEYARDRDPDSGWYSYMWRISDKVVSRMLNDFENGAAGQREGEFTESGEKYYCKDCGPERVVRFEDACDTKFKCKGCGKDMVFLE